MKTLLVLLLALSPLAHAWELPKRPDPVCERFTTGEWWKVKSHIMNLKVARDKVVAFGIYTQHKGTLKLTAQLFPLYPKETLSVRLEIKTNGKWQEIAKQDINPLGWNTTFRVENWDGSKSIPYRLRHGKKASYQGLIRRDPTDKDVISVAAFSCDSPKGKSDRSPYIRNIKHQDPDLVFWAGDQSYYHKEHTAGWLKWGMYYRDTFRDRPCITIPDDHDVGHGNLWGAGGKKSTRKDATDGGYRHHPEYVKMVERTQCGHLPDAFDPTPVQQGIGVYYTTLMVGDINFAIIEDRKFKSGPFGKVNKGAKRSDLVETPDYDPSEMDLKGLKLLGQRQLYFLDQWAKSKEGVIKVALSQTSFASSAHLYGKNQKRRYADLDTNGWPQTGRNKALRLIQQANAVHIAGDQHLGTLLQHGIDDYRDGPWAFCSPASINTYYGRGWHPEGSKAGGNPDSKNPLPWNGDYLDGFGNKLTMQAYANKQGNYNGEGYGLIKFKKSTREVTFECWPREVDVTQPSAKQFPGWPHTVKLAK